MGWASSFSWLVFGYRAIYMYWSTHSLVVCLNETFELASWWWWHSIPYLRCCNVKIWCPQSGLHFCEKICGRTSNGLHESSDSGDSFHIIWYCKPSDAIDVQDVSSKLWVLFVGGLFVPQLILSSTLVLINFSFLRLIGSWLSGNFKPWTWNMIFQMLSRFWPLYHRPLSHHCPENRLLITTIGTVFAKTGKAVAAYCFTRTFWSGFVEAILISSHCVWSFSMSNKSVSKFVTKTMVIWKLSVVVFYDNLVISVTLVVFFSGIIYSDPFYAQTDISFLHKQSRVIFPSSLLIFMSLSTRFEKQPSVRRVCKYRLHNCKVFFTVPSWKIRSLQAVIVYF